MRYRDLLLAIDFIKKTQNQLLALEIEIANLKKRNSSACNVLIETLEHEIYLLNLKLDRIIP